MIISSWNVNSLNVRLPQVIEYLRTEQPDILGVQELKQTTDAVDTQALQNIGYNSAIFGQKTYNGVALFSRQPLENVVRGIPHFPDTQARAIAATIDGVRVLNLYVPNGKAVGDEKYHYKLQWLDKVTNYIQALQKEYSKVVIIGDFNIAPQNIDVYDMLAWQDKILCSKPEREALQKILALGFVDAFRQKNPTKQQFSWWDYRFGGFKKNLGLRIDLTLTSSHLAITEAGIDMTPRSWKRPSDHTPVWVKLDLTGENNLSISG